MDEKTAVQKIGYWSVFLEEILSLDDISEAKYQFNHDEWEMAFEILLIGIIDSEISIPEEKQNELEEIAIYCKLKDQGGIIDYYIWDKFQNWLKSQKTS